MNTAAKFFIFVTLLFSSHSQAMGSSNKSGFYGGLSYYSQNSIYAVSTARSGAAGLTGTSTYYPMLLRYFAGIGGDWSLSPYISFTHLTSMLIATETPDKGATKNVAKLAVPVTYSLGSDFDFGFGPGIEYYTIKGKGGTKELNNGTSTTSFGLPSRTQNATNIFWTLDFGYTNGPSRVDFQIDILNIMSSDRRAYDLLLSYAYQFIN